MALDDLRSHEQPDAKTRVIPGSCIARPEEALEEPLLLFAGDADAPVGDRDARFEPDSLDAHDDLAALRAVLEPVGEEVHQHLLEARLVALDLHGARLAVEDQLVVVRPGAVVGDYLLGEIVQVDDFVGDLHPLRLEPRDVEQVLHQLGEPSHLPLRLGGERRVDRLPGGQAALDRLQVHRERSERRAQLVGGDGEEVGALPVELALLGDVGIDDEPPEIGAVAAAHRHRVARHPAMAGALELQLVDHAGAAVLEDLAHAGEQLFAVGRDHLDELAPVNLLPPLTDHAAERNAEELLQTR